MALDCAVDTTTPAGEAMARVLATFAQFERRLIGQRTREALAIRKAPGAKLGRPPEVPVKVERRIARKRKAGKSYAKIATGLNADGVPTTRGASGWSPETVRVVARPAS